MAAVVACGRAAEGEHAAPAASAAVATTPIVDASPSDAGVALTVVPQKPLVGLPDAFEPSGALVGKRSKDRCDVWDVTTGAYRGDVARAVCDEWMSHVGHAAGRHVRTDGSTVVVEADGGGVLARHDGCWRKPAAVAISTSGEHVAALCGSLVFVWPALGGASVEVGEISPMPDTASMAFASETKVEVVVEELDGPDAWCDGKTHFVDCERFRMFHFGVGAKPESFDEGTGIARLDPFGHLLFRAGGFCGEGDCGEDIRVQALQEQTVGLEWSVVAPRDAPPLPIERRFADDGSACLVRSAHVTTTGALLGSTYSLVAKDGSDPAPLFGAMPAIAPNGRRAASLSGAAFDGDVVSLHVVTLGGADEPPVERTISLGDPGVKSLAFSADGAYVAAIYASRVSLYSADTGKAAFFWDGVDQVAFDRARPGVVFGQKGERVVARAIIASPDAAPPAFDVPGRLLRGSFAGGHPAFVSQHGTIVAVDGGGTRVGEWTAEGTDVTFGEGGLAAFSSATGVSVVSLGRSGSPSWTVKAAGRARFVGRELWIRPAKAPGVRYDAETGAELGPVTLPIGAESAPDGSWSCGDAVVRRDGAKLVVVDGAAVTESGAYQGARRGASATVLRGDGDPLVAALLRAGQLPPRAGLVSDFFAGATIGAPVLASPIPSVKHFFQRFTEGASPRTEIWIVAEGRILVTTSVGASVATVEPGAPGTVHHLVFDGMLSLTAQACFGDVCTDKRLATFQTQPPSAAMLQ